MGLERKMEGWLSCLAWNGVMAVLIGMTVAKVVCCNTVQHILQSPPTEYGRHLGSQRAGRLWRGRTSHVTSAPLISNTTRQAWDR